MSDDQRISPRTIDVLKAIKKLNTADRRDVADFLKMPRETVSSIFTRLEKMKLIERVQNKVGLRVVNPKVTFIVTKKGSAAIQAGPTAPDRKPRVFNVYARAASFRLPGEPEHAVAQPRQVNVMTQPVYQPDKQFSTRPGADDHKQFKSKGN